MLGLHQPVMKPRAGQRVVWFLCLWIIQTFYFGMCDGTARRDVVRKLVSSSRVDVCLQETKMEDISRIMVLQMLGRNAFFKSS
jgi:hypothetical protein